MARDVVDEMTPDPARESAEQRVTYETNPSAPCETAPRRPTELPDLVVRLKAWRARNDISQAEAAELLRGRGLRVRLRTLQEWEAGRAAPNAFAALAIKEFLDKHPTGAHRFLLSFNLMGLSDSLSLPVAEILVEHRQAAGKSP